jgi:hypothetical protein
VEINIESSPMLDCGAGAREQEQSKRQSRNNTIFMAHAAAGKMDGAKELLFVAFIVEATLKPRIRLVET